MTDIAFYAKKYFEARETFSKSIYTAETEKSYNIMMGMEKEIKDELFRLWTAHKITIEKEEGNVPTREVHRYH